MYFKESIHTYILTTYRYDIALCHTVCALYVQCAQVTVTSKTPCMGVPSYCIIMNYALGCYGTL